MVRKTVIDMDCEIPVEEARLLLWAELMWPAEWAQLRMSPVYRGADIPHGNGEPVIVVPGFLGSDVHTGEMRRWLARAGYEAHVSGIGRNIDCPDVSLERLEVTLVSVAERSGQPVHIVGHSLGGMLARAAAVRRAELVSQVVTLGSPLRGVRARRAVLWIARLLGDITPRPSVSPREHTGHLHDGTCACALMEALASPFPASVSRISVFSRHDGIVDWRACVDASPRRNVEVNGSHLGMLVNKDVYQAVAKALAAPRERVQSPSPAVGAPAARAA